MSQVYFVRDDGRIFDEDNNLIGYHDGPLPGTLTWEGIPERLHNGAWGTEIRHRSEQRPEIGDSVHVIGWKGAEWMATITGIVRRRSSSTIVFNTPPPWNAKEYHVDPEVAAKAKSLQQDVENRQAEITRKVRMEMGRCPDCGESPPECLCVRETRERELLMQSEREKRRQKQQAEKYLKETEAAITAVRKEVEKRRKLLTRDVVITALKAVDNDLWAAGQALMVETPPRLPFWGMYTIDSDRCLEMERHTVPYLLGWCRRHDVSHETRMDARFTL